jgi:uncharacterized protein
MQLKHYRDPHQFAEMAFPFLKQDECGNNLLLGLLTKLNQKTNSLDSATLAAFENEQQHISGVVWHTPPFPFGITNLTTQQIQMAASYASTISPRPTAVIGPYQSASEFKDEWMRLTGDRTATSTGMRLFEATKVIDPISTPGEMRLATKEDLTLLYEWSYGYAIDIGEPISREMTERKSLQSIHDRERYVWANNGLPVAMADQVAVTKTCSRIAWVYTPPNGRAKGYASNLVAALTKLLIKNGRRPIL